MESRSAATCQECGAPAGRIHGFSCSRYPNIMREKPSAAIAHLRAVLADDGNCTADAQDNTCPRCQARAFLDALDGKTPRVSVDEQPAIDLSKNPGGEW